MKYVAVNENTMEELFCNNLRTLWRIIMSARKEDRELCRRSDSWRLGLTELSPEGYETMRGKPFAEVPGGFSNCVIIRRNGELKYFIL